MIMGSLNSLVTKAYDQDQNSLNGSGNADMAQWLTAFRRLNLSLSYISTAFHAENGCLLFASFALLT